MSVTAATDWTHVRPQPNWLMRLFDWKPFLVFMCMLPAAGLLLVFLTYPLGLGLARLHRHHHRPQRAMDRHREFRVPARRPTVLERGVLQRLLHGRRHRREVRPRPLAGAAVEQPPAVKSSSAPSSCCPGSCQRCSPPSRSGGSTTRNSPSSPTCSWTSSPDGRVHRLPRLRLAGTLLVDRGEHLARHPLRGDLPPRRPPDHLALALRGGAAGRLHRWHASASSPSRCCCRSWRS